MAMVQCRTTEIAAILALGFALSEAQGSAQSRTAGIVVAALGCAYALQTVLAFKIAFSPPQATMIEGVQGRYWILPYALMYFGAVLCVPGARLLSVGTVPLLLLWAFIDVHFVLAALKGYAANWH